MNKPLAPIELERAFYEINTFRGCLCGAVGSESAEAYLAHRREHIAEALAETAHYIHANNAFRPLFELSEEQQRLIRERFKVLLDSDS